MSKLKMFICCALAAVAVANAQLDVSAITVGVNPATHVGAFMNVSEVNPDGTAGAGAFGSGWGFADLTAVHAPGTLTLGPNTIGDPNEFWYLGGRPGEDPGDPNDNGGPGATGNKFMDANSFTEVNDGSLAGQTLTFEGNVLSNTLVGSPGVDDGSGNFTHHEAFVFIRDFPDGFAGAPVETIVPLPTTPGPFSITQALINDPTREVQYGFAVRGRNVWATDVGPFGSVVIGTIPEPTTIGLLSIAGIACLGMRKRS